MPVSPVAFAPTLASGAPLHPASPVAAIRSTTQSLPSRSEQLASIAVAQVGRLSAALRVERQVVIRSLTPDSISRQMRFAASTIEEQSRPRPGLAQNAAERLRETLTDVE